MNSFEISALGVKVTLTIGNECSPGPLFTIILKVKDNLYVNV